MKVYSLMKQTKCGSTEKMSVLGVYPTEEMAYSVMEHSINEQAGMLCAMDPSDAIVRRTDDSISISDMFELCTVTLFVQQNRFHVL